jgi:hypothetical protein
MSKRKSRPYTGPTIIVVLGALIALLFYMWNYDYKVVRPREFTLKRDLRMALRIDQKGEYGYGGAVAIVTLANATQGRVRMLQTASVFPLYELKLVYKPGAGQPKELPLRMDVAQKLAKEEFVYDKDNDAIPELVMGTAHTRAIPLNYYFDLREKGEYELTVKYDPEKVAELMGTTFDYLDVTRESLSMTVQFQFPEAQPEESPKKAPAAEKPATGETEKTPPTNSLK